MNTVNKLDGVGSLAHRYPIWLCDIWGVIHNGVAAHEAAVEALTRYRSSGGAVALITNAPRPSPEIALQLDNFGVPSDAYDAIITSGDVTRTLLEDRQSQAMFHLGPARDAPIYAGLEIEFGALEEAECILCTGLFNDETETPGDYADMLSEAAERELLMICANPDRVVHRGEKLIYCAGALADVYSALGAEVIFAGKPYAPIYDLALKYLEEFCGLDPEPKHVLAIGDSMQTDIAGAASLGFDALFITGGIHAQEMMDEEEGGQVLSEYLDELQAELPSLNLVGTQTQLWW